MKSRLLFVIALVGVLAFAQTGFAQTHHYQIKVVPRQQGQLEEHQLTVPANLYTLAAYFAVTPFTVSSNPVNGDNTDLWPCFGGGTAAPNADCSTLGDPSQAFPAGGVVIGSPAYTWSQTACNAISTTQNYCGEAETWYEDDSSDSTDELIYSVVATQGTTVIYDSGTVDFGPNTFGATPGADVIIYGPSNLGTMGQTGVNNGNCSADFPTVPDALGYTYPLTSAANPGATYVVAAGKTCGAAVSGAVSFEAVTSLAKPTYTEETTNRTGKCSEIQAGTVVGVVGPPCWITTYTKIHTLTQKWTIYLQ